MVMGGHPARGHLSHQAQIVELEKSFQNWCITWGPFRSRNVSARPEDSSTAAVAVLRGNVFAVRVPVGLRPGGLLIKLLINY